MSAAAKDALLFLLKGRLMMTASTWDRLNEALHPVTPILQVLWLRISGAGLVKSAVTCGTY